MNRIRNAQKVKEIRRKVIYKREYEKFSRTMLGRVWTFNQNLYSKDKNN